MYLRSLGVNLIQVHLNPGAQTMSRISLSLGPALLSFGLILRQVFTKR